MQPKHLVLALALGFATGLAAAPFEGIATYKPLGKDAKAGHEIEFSIKGDKVRVDMDNGGRKGVMIMDNKTREAITLMPERKAYMVMKLESKSTVHKKKPRLVATGKNETIAGYKAEEMIYDDGDSKISLWGNSELGGWAFSSGGGQGAQVEIPAKFKAGGYFPLRMLGEKGGMEATKVEPKSLDASLFEIPKGYEKMDMGAMMGGHSGAGAAPMGEMSAADKKAMAEQMKNMTPEQRAMLEKMMKGK